MSDKLARPEGKECYAQRKAIVEPVNGWVKHVLGFRQFSVRGLQAVRGEWDLVCLALNLRRMQPAAGPGIGPFEAKVGPHEPDLGSQSSTGLDG